MTPGERHDSARRPTHPKWAVAFACWVTFIWGHSLVQGPQSSLESGMVVALVSVVDECIQLFVPGRTGQPTDVLIDLGGLVFGVLLAWFVSTRLPERA